MSKHNYETATVEIEGLVRRMEPLIKKLSSDPRGWWQNRRRYSRLSENIAKSCVLSKLRDVRIRGRAEADRFIEKQFFGKKTDIPSEMLEFMSKNRGIWADFIYKIAATQDIEALTGFFVPLIYGGVISRKNITGEAFGIVDFGENNSKTPQNERIMKAMRTITSFRQRGIGIILIEGRADEIYSPQMLSVYRGSPNEAFIIVEREGKNINGGIAWGQSAYARTILSELCAAKNVFVLLEPNDSGEAAGGSSQNGRIAGKSRALSSYGILHGIWGNCGDVMGLTNERESDLIVFDCKTSLSGALGSSLSRPKRADEFFGLLPRPIIDFLSSPSLPIYLPSLYELLIMSQFILTGGKMREIRREIV